MSGICEQPIDSEPMLGAFEGAVLSTVNVLLVPGDCTLPTLSVAYDVTVYEPSPPPLVAKFAAANWSR